MRTKRIEKGDKVDVMFNSGENHVGTILDTPCQGAEYWIIDSTCRILYVHWGFASLRLREKEKNNENPKT